VTQHPRAEKFARVVHKKNRGADHERHHRPVPAVDAERDGRFVEAEKLGGAAALDDADGEYGGRIPATLEMLPDALTLLAPATYR